MTQIRPPGPVPKEAFEFFRRKNVQPGFDYRDVWKDEHNVAFTVAKAMELQVLQTIRGEVERALRDGTTLRTFQKDLRPRLEQLGWWGKKDVEDPRTGDIREVQLGSPRRLETIYRTNLRTARAAGQWDRIQRTKDVAPMLVYRLGPSERHRPEHEAWNGVILPVDDEFWLTHMPPNGWGCKCYVVQIDEDQAEQMGGQSRRPDTTPVSWYNSRTGQTEQVPRGIDPGWDYNPGITRQPPQRGPSSATPSPAPTPPPKSPRPAALAPIPQRAIEVEDGVLERASELLKRKVDASDLAALSGLRDADVKLSLAPKGGIKINAEADLPGGGDVSAQRMVRPGDDGPWLENQIIKVSKEAQGQGHGTSFFLQQVEVARRLGLREIQAYAARGEEYNGYYTWARLGYDGPLPEDLQTLTGLRTVLEMMRTKEMQDLWRKEGEGFEATFDLRPGSESLKRLAQYVKDKERKR